MEEYNLNRLAHRVLDGAVEPHELTTEQLDAVINLYEMWLNHYTYDSPMNAWDYEPPALKPRFDELKEIRSERGIKR